MLIINLPYRISSIALWACLIIFISACARPTTVSPPSPAIDPEISDPEKELPPPAEPVEKPSRTWTIKYRSGTYRYHINTEDQVALLDSVSTRGLDNILNSASPLSLFFSDTDGNTTDNSEQGNTLINYDFRSVPSLSKQTTVEITDTGFVVIDPAEPEYRNCDEVRSLIVQARNILPALPSDLPPNLTIGSEWTDSVSVQGCRGAIPMSSTSWRTFEVIGDTVDTNYDTEALLIIKKTEKLKASGEGNENQHRILVNAHGSGESYLYFSVPMGTFVKVVTRQVTRVDVTTSGRKNTFVQKKTENVTLEDT